MNRQQLVFGMQANLFARHKHQDLPGCFQLGILPLMQKELVRRIAWLNSGGIKSQTCISDLSSFQCWNTSEVFSCSSFPTDAMLWTTEVEMVDFVDDLK